MRTLRVGCVPYLNGKPLVEWFHTPGCEQPADVTYAVPSELARQLRAGALDVALVSIFELFRHPGLRIVPGIAIAADGPVKSVRLFSCQPFEQIRSVALDTSSLTSTALTRILLTERYGLSPRYVSHVPDLDAMLSMCDAGLIIGDLKLFDSPARYIMDLGQAWKELTGFPFVYAAWLMRENAEHERISEALTRAKTWGTARLDALSRSWSEKMGLPLDRVEDYFQNVMRYDLGANEREGLRVFQELCLRHGLVKQCLPLLGAGDGG